MNISGVEVKVRPDTGRWRPDLWNELRGNPGILYQDPEDLLREVTLCPDRHLETSNASTTEEPSKKREEECSQSIHSRLRVQQTKTQIRGPRKVNHYSRQVRKLDVTEAPVLKYGLTLGRERCH